MIVNNGKASKKQAKKTIPRKVPIPSEIFISPHKIVEMACREEAKFVKMMKECDIKECKKKFTPRGEYQRFCSSKHKDLWHARERQRILLMARKLGVGK